MIGPWLAGAALVGLGGSLHFEPAAPGADGGARYVARAAGHAALVDSDGITLALFAPPGGGAAAPRATAVRIRLAAARRVPPRGRNPLGSRSHYLKGRDPRAWRVGVPHYERVALEGAYPGIDVVLHGRGRALEADFVLAPAADPGRIRLRFEGARGLRVARDGRLLMQTDAGTLALRAPVAYQDGAQGRTVVPCSYEVRRGGQVIFALGAHDTTRPLVIDPVLDYSSYLGGGDWDGIRGLAVDAQGYRYVAGSTLSADFPVVGPTQGTLAGGYDVFVAKLDPQGSALIHSTFLGGSAADQARGLAVDAGGNVHVAGVTESADFPVQGAVQAAPGGGQDAFVAALSPSGASLVYSTYLGGDFHDAAEGLALASTGVVVVGWTQSSDFPTERPLQPFPGGGTSDAFVARLALGGSPLQFSTYLGGGNADRAHAVAVDGGDVAHVGGVTLSLDFPVERPLQPARAGDYDGFLAGIDGTGAGLRYSTYLGGSAGETLAAVAAGGNGAVYVAGSTLSADFPTRRGYQHGKSGPPTTTDGFVAKVDTSASTLVYATYLGGSDHDVIGALAVDAGGHAHVTGETRSADFPLVHEVMERPGTVDAFVAKLDAAGRRLVFSTCFGGRLGSDTGEALAVTADGAVHVGGRTDAPDLPLAGPVQPYYGGQGDAFLARIQPGAVTWDLVVDATPTATSNGNGVLDLHEEVVASPAWRNDGPAPLTTTGAASSFAGPGGVFVTYSVEDNSADYGTLAPGQTVSCAGTGDCFRLRLTSIALRRSFHWDAVFRELLTATGAFVKWTVHVGETFLDVPRSSPFARYVETLAHLGVTGGCVAHGEIYCPTAPVTRADLAVVIAGARDRPRFVPASCASGPRLFADVKSSSPICPWVESLARRGVVAGCSSTHFCPDQVVTREQVAVLVLAALEGSHYRPPACTTPAFTDVPAASPYCAWIEELARRGVAAGCGGGAYCPQAAVTREQMALFVAAGLELRLGGP